MSKTEEDKNYAKGLEGVIAAETALSFVDGANSQLYYRGIPVHEFMADSCYEEVVYLLWNHHLPSKEEFKTFTEQLASERSISDELIQFLKALPKDAHPMAILRTAASYFGCEDKDADAIDIESSRRISMGLTAKIPTVLAAWHRIREGKDPIAPDLELSHAANFLYMFNGEKPSSEMEKALDTYLILLADHGLNASTFSARVTIATKSDIYSAITSAIGTLKGDLHGSAVQRAMETFLEVGEPENAESYTREKLAKKEKIMGFGHRVYKKQDPRAVAFREFATKLAESSGETKWLEIANGIEKVVTGEKGIPCNVDFFSSYVLYIVGFPVDFFTTIFATSRVSGWTAHVIEQLSDNRLIRPKAQYIGPKDQHYIPIEER